MKSGIVFLMLAVFLLLTSHCFAFCLGGAPLVVAVSTATPYVDDDPESILQTIPLVWFIFALLYFLLSVFRRYCYAYFLYGKRPPILSLPIGGNSPPPCFPGATAFIV